MAGSPVRAADDGVPLRNAQAQIGNDCPADTSVAYWHFVITPNNGTYSFQTITLNVGGTSYAFNGFPPIMRNGTQTDNVFVAVPDGKHLNDLAMLGSSASITPDSPAPNAFNLSHICPNWEPATTANPPTITTQAPAQPDAAEFIAPTPTTKVIPAAVAESTTTTQPDAAIMAASSTPGTSTVALAASNNIALPLAAIAALIVFAGVSIEVFC